jgi:uncharacterized protein YbjT (DUF2867 family)
VTRDVFVTGGTGYLGRPLIETLLARGHRVRALTRTASAGRLPSGTHVVTGNALEPAGWASQIAPADTFVHLVGTPHPNPTKADEFRGVDLASIRAAIAAASSSSIGHFVYVSVAHPAPVMQTFIEVRMQGEALVRARGIPATILRPWYVLGPGHRWPYLLVPLYAVARLVPSMRGGAERLALVSRKAMIAAMVQAIESPPTGVRIVEPKEIGRARLD